MLQSILHMHSRVVGTKMLGAATTACEGHTLSGSQPLRWAAIRTVRCKAVGMCSVCAEQTKQTVPRIEKLALQKVKSEETQIYAVRHEKS